MRMDRDTTNVWMESDIWEWVQQLQDVERILMYWHLVSLCLKKQSYVLTLVRKKCGRRESLGRVMFGKSHSEEWGRELTTITYTTRPQHLSLLNDKFWKGE